MLQFSRNDVEALYNRSMVLFRLKRLDDFPIRGADGRLTPRPMALEAAARLVHFHPENPSGYYARGLILEALGDTRLAEDDFDRYVELGGDAEDIAAAHRYVAMNVVALPPLGFDDDFDAENEEFKDD